MSALKNIVIAVTVGMLFVLLYAAGILSPLEERVYDFFLGGRPERARVDNVVFLDVDDAAIAYNGVFPWPRSVMADGFLRLKEYGASAAILDIEFIDRGPAGIDSVYFNRDFPADFEKTFSEIGGNVSDLLEALRSGRIRLAEVDHYGAELAALIRGGRESLFQKASGIARDNDIYLARASALFGRSWATLNLQTQPLSGEQAERRPLAERKFSWQVEMAEDVPVGAYVDILPPIESFSEAARGAGFTNVVIDPDGVRRRIFPVQKVQDHFYLQLAFAPLMEYLGKPSIRLEERRLVLGGAMPPGGVRHDIVIPLDKDGRMMLDWPETNYNDSFSHISFAEISRLEELETGMEQYLAALETAELAFFAQFDVSLSEVFPVMYQSGGLLREAREVLNQSLAEQSEEKFSRHLALRGEAMEMLRSLAELRIGAKVRAIAETLAGDQPGDSVDAQVIGDEADYIARITEYLQMVMDQYLDLRARLTRSIAGKFCVIGRVDTGTTDIGVNPFYGEYVNAGTHAVVLDMIQRESFITPLPVLWSAALCPVPALFLMLALRGLRPVPRAGLGLGGVFLFGFGCFLVFRYSGVFIAPLGPVLAALSAVIIREMISYRASDREKQFISRALSTYVSREVVDELVANPLLLQLGGSRRRMSAVFTDMRSFSTISEQLDPEHLVRLLNRYLTRMSDIIMENMGTIDKYEGDAIIAFFGAPVRRDDHAVLACRSALRMKKVETDLNRELIEEGLVTAGVLAALKDKGIMLDERAPTPLYTRIGINTGEMVVGNMGTSTKMNYTIMGNAVNLAARLEGVNKLYNTGGILISEYTRNEIGEGFMCRGLDRVRVVGISTPVRLYELLALREEASAEDLEICAAWEKALALYENREFLAAEEIFGDIAARSEQDGAARLYTGVCRGYIDAPPPRDWDG
ncbi:MAG: adenylate/guanylate cyclase domain-containing protein, partial [Spirochaetales bacterium]|nr:adenylate/guanylate cyclase domain-containing protein [Spirochaetales bacterium]